MPAVRGWLTATRLKVGEVLGVLRDVVEKRALVGDVVHEQDGGPALALEPAPDIGEIVRGQRVGGVGLVRAAADVIRLGARRQGKIVRQVVMIGELDRGAPFAAPAGSACPD